MAYTTIDKPSDYFNTKLYTGTGSEHAISGIGFAPNLVWLKCRSDANNPMLFDTVRGATKNLYPNLTTAEGTEAQSLKSFDSDGYTLGTESDINGSSKTNVGWNWKAGTSFTNDASATGIGSVDSAGSVNTDAGFSIINVVKNNTTAHTVAHGLGAVPQMIIGKSRTGGSYRWIVYHQAIGNTHAQYLNENFANTDSVTFWNDTSPTSSVFSLGTDNSWNGTNIFYCFAEKKGYSKFGIYSSNSNANGPFVYLGFKPAFVIVKCTTAAEGWGIMDSTREPTNDGSFATLDANNSSSEGSLVIDFLSNGFKPRQVSGQINKSGSHSYIYMAFAENPFVTSTGVPATAR